MNKYKLKRKNIIRQRVLWYLNIKVINFSVHLLLSETLGCVVAFLKLEEKIVINPYRTCGGERSLATSEL